MTDYDVKDVAIYIRKSRAESDDDLQKHRSALIELCEKNSFRYVEYSEVGTSDSIDDRPKMVELLKDIEHDMFDAVCVIDYDRLGRGNGTDQDRITNALKNTDTLIITLTQVLDLNNEDDDLTVDFKSFFARQEYKMIKKRLQRGKKLGAKRGDWTNGTPPFPYEYEKYKDKRNPKGLVINDEKLPTYRFIIDSLLAGKTSAAIAQELNKRRVISPRGSLWHGGQIYRLAISEVHLGKVISNKTAGDGHKNKSNAKPVKALPPEEWVVVENCHEPVKTIDEHEKIIYLLSERQKIPKRARQCVYPLSGLIVCSKCGHTHSFLTKDNDSVLMKPCWYTDPYGNKCKNRGAMAHIIETALINEIHKYKERIQYSGEETEALRAAQIEADIDDIRRRLKKNEDALIRIMDSYEMGDYTRQEFLERKQNREAEISLLRKELSDLSRQLNNIPLIKSADKLEKFESFIENIESTATPKERNELYRTIVNRIVWTRDADDIKIEIEYK